MDFVQSVLRDYGASIYVLLFAYCALKSGTLPLFAGYAAQNGMLDLSSVGISTFLGGYLGDEARFWLARRYGDGLVEGRPRLTRLVETGKALLDKYGGVYIFLYRYPKGMRTVGAFPLGFTTIRWRSFTALNAASAGLWTMLIVGAGYLFGSAIEQAIKADWGFYSFLALALFVAAILLAWRRLLRSTAGPKGGT